VVTLAVVKAPSPLELIAATRTVYAVLAVSPVIEADVAVPTLGPSDHDASDEALH